MGAIKVHEFMTLDGIIDAPMWTMDYPFTDSMEESLGRLTGSCSDILLGRRTYEMFAQAWPTRTVEEDAGATFFNDTRPGGRLTKITGLATSACPATPAGSTRRPAGRPRPVGRRAP